MRDSHPGYRASIRAEMARRELRMADVGAAIGLSKQAMSRRLLGQVPLRAEELQRLADFFGVPASVLLGETERVAS